MRPPSEGEAASQGSPPEPQPPTTRSMRVSAQEREETLRWLQTAFAEDRLNDEELEARLRAALTAWSQEELGRLLADLPAPKGQPVLARRVRSLVIAVMGATTANTRDIISMRSAHASGGHRVHGAERVRAGRGGGATYGLSEREIAYGRAGETRPRPRPHYRHYYQG